MNDECVVVTGASGYIGSHIVANLLLKGKKVRATVRDSQDHERVKHLKEMEVSENGSLLSLFLKPTPEELALSFSTISYNNGTSGVERDEGIFN